MPLYEFECEACEKRFERIQKFSDPNPETCPACGKGPVRKLPSSPAIQFKGSGFYITDYAKKSTSEAGGSSKSSSGEKSGDRSGGEKGGDRSGAEKSGDSKSGGDSASSATPASTSSTDSKSSGDKKS
jgi:putative FmdB family regulatory protein